ncbi:MAG: PrsW family intramembrane metalloprotease [Lachnospiraceae bacterium]|nr:PrsW family intramembrane metalloprotease [Lachnospiraceae bacterium]
MFYYLVAPLLAYHWFLIAVAVIPAIFLMVKVYRSDRLEKESPGTLLNMAVGGVLATLVAAFAERLGVLVLGLFVSSADPIYDVILYFVVVGLVEEAAKYYFLKRRSWGNPEFNCQYDGVVFSVFVSLGFALWENISYVLHYGFATGLVRAVTAIPGHASFGVLMGAFYGLSAAQFYLGNPEKSKRLRVMAVLVPAIVHGFYDYLASTPTMYGEGYFAVFVIVLFLVAYRMVSKLSKNDAYFHRTYTGPRYWE